MTRWKTGHAPGYVRDAFCEAVDAFISWRIGEPEPMVELVELDEVEITISSACGLVWKCTDVLPSNESDRLAVEYGKCPATYAAASRLMLKEIKRWRTRSTA